MPELPDIVAYIEALEKRILGQKLEQIRIVSPFLLRTAVPPLRLPKERLSRNCDVWESESVSAWKEISGW